MLAFLCEHWCLQRSRTPSTIDLSCFEDPVWYTFHAYGIFSKVMNLGSILGTPLWPCVDLVLWALRVGHDNSQFWSCLMQLITRSTTCHSSRIVCWDTHHAIFASILANFLLHPFLELGARTLSSKRMNDDTFLWRCSFQSDWCLFKDGVLSLMTRGLCLVWIRAGFVLAVRIFFTPKFCPFLQQRIVPNARIWERIATGEYPRTIWRFCVDGITTSKESSPSKYVVVDSKTKQVRTLSVKAHTDYELRSSRGSVFYLYTTDDPSQFFIESRVTKYYSFPAWSEKSCLCNIWAMILWYSL